MSKHSLVDETIYAKVINEVRSINAFAEIQDLDARPVHMSDMFGLELFYASEKKILEMQEHAEEEYCEECGHTHAHGDHEHEHHHHDHDHDHEHHDHDHEHEHEHDHHDHDHEHHHHHSHSHHSGINSFVIETDKPLVLANINEWLNELVYIYGPELYRYKGILNVEGLDYQIIFQGVQMSFDISRGRDWNDTKRSSTLVFIGKNLPENQLRESFIACTEK